MTTTRESRSYHTQAIVLGHSEYGEADRILKLFTREKGRISAIAKGVRKIRSRKAGHLEPFTLANLMLAKGRNLDIVTQAETVNAFMGLKDDLESLAVASYIIEVLERFTFQEGKNLGIFRLLVNTLTRLETHEFTEVVVHYYEMRLLDLLGFRPQLFTCIDCGKVIKAEDQYFSPLAGGVVCPRCKPGRPEAWPVSKDILKYLRHFQRSNWKQLSLLKLPEEIEAGLTDLITQYLTYLLERKLNTPNFIAEIRRNRDINKHQ